MVSSTEASIVRLFLMGSTQYLNRLNISVYSTTVDRQTGREADPADRQTGR